MLGLVEAAINYIPGKCKFQTYSYYAITGRILDDLRKEYPKGYGRSSIAQLTGIECPNIIPMSRLSNRDLRKYAPECNGGYENTDYYDLVKGLSKRLPPKVGEVFRLYYLHAGMNIIRVGKITNLSPTTVVEYLKKARKHLREVLGETYDPRSLQAISPTDRV